MTSAQPSLADRGAIVTGRQPGPGTCDCPRLRPGGRQRDAVRARRGAAGAAARRGGGARAARSADRLAMRADVLGPGRRRAACGRGAIAQLGSASRSWSTTPASTARWAASTKWTGPSGSARWTSTSTARCCRCARCCRTSSSSGYGKIVQLSGGGATNPLPRITAYAASKAAIVRLAETSRSRSRPYGIDVNCIAPGALNTRMLDELLAAGPTPWAKAFTSG